MDALEQDGRQGVHERVLEPSERAARDEHREARGRRLELKRDVQAVRDDDDLVEVSSLRWRRTAAGTDSLWCFSTGCSSLSARCATPSGADPAPLTDRNGRGTEASKGDPVGSR